MRALPHVDLETRPSMSGEEKLHFKMKPEPPEEERTPFRKSLTMTDTKQLYTVVMKARQAKIVIPELEFEIGADNKRLDDSIFGSRGGRVIGDMTHNSSVLENSAGTTGISIPSTTTLGLRSSIWVSTLDRTARIWTRRPGKRLWTQ